MECLGKGRRPRFLGRGLGCRVGGVHDDLQLVRELVSDVNHISNGSNAQPLRDTSQIQIKIIRGQTIKDPFNNVNGRSPFNRTR